MSVSDRPASGPIPPVLTTLPLLARMPDDVRDLVAHTFEERRYSFGDEIVKEGDDADAFYVIASGRARVVKRDEDGAEIAVNTLEAGDAFGELALIERAKRSATVRASGEVEVLRLERSVFDALVRTHPDARGYLEEQVERHRLRDFVKVYTPFARVSAETAAALIERLEPVSVRPGEIVVAEGDEPGPLFVVREGRLRVHGTHGDLAFLRKGDFFGEASVLRERPRSASVTAVADSELLRLPADAYRALLEAESGVHAALVPDAPATETPAADELAPLGAGHAPR